MPWGGGGCGGEDGVVCVCVEAYPEEGGGGGGNKNTHTHKIQKKVRLFNLTCSASAANEPHSSPTYLWMPISGSE